MRNFLKKCLWTIVFGVIFNIQSADFKLFNDVLKKYSFSVDKVLVDKDSLREQLMSSALSLVAYHNEEDVAVLEILLKELSKESKQAKKTILNNFCFDGCTVLVAAVLSKNFKKVRLLLHYGADSNLKDSKYGLTPLIHALENKFFEIALLLCSRGANQEIDGYCGDSIAFLRHQIALKNEKKSKDKGAAGQVEKKKKQSTIDPDTIYGMLMQCSGAAHFTFDKTIINQNDSSLTEDDKLIQFLQDDYNTEKDDVNIELIAVTVSTRNKKSSEALDFYLENNQPDALLSQEAIERFKAERKIKSALALRRAAKKIKILVSDYDDVQQALVAGFHKRKSEGDHA